MPAVTLRLGTRGSPLALWQARHVAQRLRELDPALTVEEHVITTEGDVQQHAPLAQGDRGVFVRRIEQALLAGSIDLAVHSLKDLPTTQPAGLVIGAVPERHDPRDAVVSADGATFEELAPGARVGTGSFRRRTQLLQARPELRFEPVRGNIDTRVRKMREGRFDAVILALAGLERLGITAAPFRPIPLELCLPAVGQGALAVECRSDDAALLRSLAQLDHTPSRRAVDAERAFLRRLGGGCLAPATGHARLDGATLRLRAAVGDADGRELLRDAEEGPATDAEAIGERLARRMLAAGAARLLEAARESEGADGAG